MYYDDCTKYIYDPNLCLFFPDDFHFLFMLPVIAQVRFVKSGKCNDQSIYYSSKRI